MTLHDHTLALETKSATASEAPDEVKTALDALTADVN